MNRYGIWSIPLLAAACNASAVSQQGPLANLPATATPAPTLPVAGVASPAPEATPVPTRLEAAIAPVAPGIWQDLPPLKHPRAFHGLFRYRGIVMAMGGDNRNQLEVLDERTAQWTARPFADPGTGWETLPFVPALMHPLSPPVLFGPWVMLLANPLEVGGFTVDFTPLLFNPFTGQMSPGPSSLSSFSAHRSAVGAIPDGDAQHVYVAGGEATREISDSYADYPPHLRATFRTFERVSFESLRWQRLADLPEPVSDPAVAWAPGSVYVAGGLSWLDADGKPGKPEVGQVVVEANGARPAAEAWCWRYDITEDRWERLPDLPMARHGARAAIVGARLWVVGGRDDRGETVSRCDVLDLDKRVWSTGPNTRHPRSHAALRADESGDLWLAGGLDVDRRPMDSVEILRGERP